MFFLVVLSLVYAFPKLFKRQDQDMTAQCIELMGSDVLHREQEKYKMLIKTYTETPEAYPETIALTQLGTGTDEATLTAGITVLSPNYPLLTSQNHVRCLFNFYQTLQNTIDQTKIDNTNTAQTQPVAITPESVNFD